MLAIHILNVGHGDSIVLEYRNPGDNPAFAVIDSNARSGETPRALKKLRELGAQTLSFLAITHPHSDHYSGMSEIMRAYEGRIEKLYTYPIEKSDLKKLASIAQTAFNNSDSPAVGYALKEFVGILVEGKKIRDEWYTETSSGHRIVAPGFSNVEFKQILPPSRIKGNFFQEIEKGILNFATPKLNDLSLAFHLVYKGIEITLGGDGTQDNWLFQHKRWKDLNIVLNSVAVKLPHHGSKTDSSRNVLDILYEGNATNVSNVACISADGRSHPDNSVLDDVIRRGLKPYCTNLAVRCGAARREKINAPDCDPALARFLSTIVVEGAEKKTQPCQGDITLRIDDEGEFSVETEHNHPCPYRGDYEKLLGNVIQ